MKTIFISLCLLMCNIAMQAQMITGVWKGKIGTGLRSQKMEVKLVQKGDSIAGTSYYYENSNHYRRYSVKGYFNQQTNEVVWWDDVLLEQVIPGFRVLSPNETPLLMEADFNCPGGGIMKLDGKAVHKANTKSKGELHLDKVEQTQFDDEWNWVIENYTVGANNPEIIDSIAQLHQPVKEPVVTAAPVPIPRQQEPKPVTEPAVTQQRPSQSIQKADTPVTAPPQNKPTVAVSKPPAIEEKFVQRKKVLTTELPLEGDTIEIHFYDNAEIDGDSISLFMNNKLVFEHVKLSDKPYVVKFAVNELTENNELVMVAENLGAIPPNTSYMIAYINKQRYTANLESTEGSSAMIRFVRRSEK
ncbi:hypothetical protein PDL71_04755 [Lacibacter sp. MH-610]|uniref:hypothetical protein n=1 Tax=Lacibacter sp. MH-610 TaxID=3020883 RepID=UPI0038912E78